MQSGQSMIVVTPLFIGDIAIATARRAAVVAGEPTATGRVSAEGRQFLQRSLKKLQRLAEMQWPLQAHRPLEVQPPLCLQYKAAVKRLYGFFADKIKKKGLPNKPTHEAK